MINRIAPRKFTRPSLGGILLPALALCLLTLAGWPAKLPACAMSALIASDGHLLSDFRQLGSASDFIQYNDPWDYLGMVMSTSRPGYYNDGYGLLSYAEDTPFLTRSRMWFKRVMLPSDFGNKYYTGNYLRNPVNDHIALPDTLDWAMTNLRDRASRSVMALCHARSASGITYGNHPFWFNFHGRTYSLMHNGNANSARAFMINRITEMNSELEWFHTHPSNHFNSHDPWQWVDSEVLFHFIMSHIIQNSGDSEVGIIKAMRELYQYLNTPGWGVYNYIMSDGIQLYAFRSTPTTGTYSNYQLSYKDGHGFYGIRTQTPGPDFVQLQAKELVIFSRSDPPRHILIRDATDPGTQDTDNDEAEISIALSPNPVTQNGILQLSIIGDLPKSAFLAYEIYNSRGQLLQKAEIAQLTNANALVIHLGKLASGVYFLRVRGDALNQTKRFTVCK